MVNFTFTRCRFVASYRQARDGCLARGICPIFDDCQFEIDRDDEATFRELILGVAQQKAPG